MHVALRDISERQVAVRMPQPETGRFGAELEVAAAEEWALLRVLCGLSLSLMLMLSRVMVCRTCSL